MAKATEIRPTTPSVTFVDKAYKSRTIVMADRRCFAVEKGRITAADPAVIEYLDTHPEFDRVTGE